MMEPDATPQLCLRCVELEQRLAEREQKLYQVQQKLEQVWIPAFAGMARG